MMLFSIWNKQQHLMPQKFDKVKKNTELKTNRNTL